MSTMISHSFPQNLKIARKQKSYSQEQLAYESELATRTIQLYEKGARHPSIPNLVKLSQVLGIKACQLYPELENMNFTRIIRERHEIEVKAVEIFIEKSNTKDRERLEQMLSIFKESDTIEDCTDCAYNIHNFLLKYIPKTNKIIAKKMITQSYQELDLNMILNDSITRNNGSIYFDIHSKLFQAILERKKSIIFSQYQSHLENQEKVLNEVSLSTEFISG